LTKQQHPQTPPYAGFGGDLKQKATRSNQNSPGHVGRAQIQLTKGGTMRQKTIMLFTFEELSDKAKIKAVEKLSDINVSYNLWWEYIYDEIENQKMKCNGFDIDGGGTCSLKWVDAEEVAKSIIENHNKNRETYADATKFLAALKPLQDALKDAEDAESPYEVFDAINDLIVSTEKFFLCNLEADYLFMLRNEYEYQTSEDAIIETIMANRYEFDEEGNLQ
jgi:hypothetical protein